MSLLHRVNTFFIKKNVKIFKKLYLIIRDIGILSEMCMGFSQNAVCNLCVNLFNLFVYILKLINRIVPDKTFSPFLKR